MKKLFVLLLCLSMLLLCACQLQTIVPPTGTVEDYYDWNVFYWNCRMGNSGSVTLPRVNDDGATEDTVIEFNGENYSITDSAGTRTYAYLLSASHVEKSGSGYLYGDYFFLTDDPGLTFEKYQKAQSTSLKDHMQLLLPTELVLGKAGVSEDVVCFGDAPKEIEAILSRHLGGSAAYYEENSFFTQTTMVVLDSGRTSYLLNRYNYNGTEICSVEIPLPVVISVTELEDGSFLASLKDSSESNENCLVRYNAEGKLLWRYDFQINRDVYLRYLFQKGDALYCFGELNADSTGKADDLYFAKFSMNGTMLKEKITGGSDFESLNHVTISGNSFTVYAETQSKDGDFPFSEDGYYAGFTAQVSDELELSGVEAYPESEYILRHYGFHNGAPVYDGDPIMNPVAADQLPDDFHDKAIFTFGDGYVILRSYTLEDYLFTPLEMSARLSYKQLIATYYDASGTPVWQTVSKPFL